MNCSCGALLRDIAVDAFSSELLELVSSVTGSNAVALSVEQRWQLARFLGALSQYGLRGKPLKKASRQKDNVEQTLVTTGASLIADQSACLELLDRLRVPQAAVNNVPLLSEVFPQLLTILRKQLSEAARNWMLNLLDAYVARSSRAGSALLWDQKHAGSQVDGTSRRRSRARKPAILAALSQTGATASVRRTRSGRQRFVINDADLQDLRKRQHALVPLKAAATHAGMSVRRMQALTKTGLIASSGSRINIGSVDCLLSKIQVACDEDTSAFCDPITVAEALRLYVPIDTSVVFFDRLMSGAIRLVRKPEKSPSLRGIYADRSAVISVVKTPCEEDSGISVVEAARRLGVKQEVMYQLINKSLIRSRMGKLGRRAARVIDVDDLLTFTEQFLPLCMVAKAMGISAREAPGWAGRHGIEIVTGPSVDGGRQYWIRRQT
ncbi:hypothetical protein ACODYM_27655 [Burkholderia gladioli]|uniref:hypothetical protein n=1 Tax=Burkholderia gladioli TaxID=28095 RepID=UPI001641301A|nr:hypothetical protein [Burkholderia gladioli]